MSYPKVYIADLKISEIQVLEHISIDGVGIEVDNIKKGELDAIVRRLNSSVEKIFITRIVDFHNIKNLIDNFNEKIIFQLHDLNLPIDIAYDIKKHFTQIQFIAPVNVNFTDAIDKAKQLDEIVDYLFICAQHKEESKLIDNWYKAAFINLQTKKPIILGGSLNKKNISQAVEIVKPFAVSTISGVRYLGNLSYNKLSNFLENIKKAEV
jgi:phosphoribosylanthranilate isomerase